MNTLTSRGRERERERTWHYAKGAGERVKMEEGRDGGPIRGN